MFEVDVGVFLTEKTWSILWEIAKKLTGTSGIRAPHPMLPVNIDFDEASKAWMKNKVKITKLLNYFLKIHLSFVRI